MKKQLLKKTFAASLAVMMLSSTAVVSQTTGLLSLTASAVTGTAAEIIDSGSCGETAAYKLDSEGTLTISGEGKVSDFAFSGSTYAKKDNIRKLVFAAGSSITEIGEEAFSGLDYLETIVFPSTLTTIGNSAFRNNSGLVNITFTGAELAIGVSAFEGMTFLQTLNIGVTDNLSLAANAFSYSTVRNITIASSFVKLHPDALSETPFLETLGFTAFDGTTVQGALYGLPETAQVTMPPFSKLYTPAQKYLSGPSVAYDTYRPAYAHAILYWEDIEPILEAAAADGVSISDSKEKLEWITNDNISTYFTDAQCSIVGTMEGDGSFANPYLIYTPQNWRYLDFLARLGKLSSSYYGMDRGTNVKLMADLTLSDRDGTFTTLGGGKHKEVHNSDYAYVGNFDGNGHTITLDVNESVDDGVQGFGLIEKTDGAYIKNLNISGRMVSSQQYTGLLVGYASSHDRIFNCSSDAVLVLEGTGEMKSGAFVGYAYRPYIENCHFTGKILGGDEITAVGGFVGELSSNSGGSTLKNCYFAPSEIDVDSTGSCMLYRPYYGSYSGWCGFAEIENNYYNAEALKLNGADMGDLDQGTSDAEGIDSLNETEF